MVRRSRGIWYNTLEDRSSGIEIGEGDEGCNITPRIMFEILFEPF